MWPTHLRFREAGAGRVAFDAGELKDAVNAYLQDPLLDAEQRQQFIRDECTYTDGCAGQRTGEWIVKLLDQLKKQ
jgi:hypothetical protein